MCSEMASIIFLSFWALMTTIQCMHDMMPTEMDGDGPTYEPEKMGHKRMSRFGSGHMESGSWEGGSQGSRRGLNPFEEHWRGSSSEMRHRSGHKSRHYAPRRRFEFSDEQRMRSHRPPGSWYNEQRRRMKFGRRRGFWRRGFRGHAAYQRRYRCPKWQKWEESSCLWPGTKPDMPKSCDFMNATKRLPGAVTKYYEAKGKEMVEVLRHVFQQRGLTKPCGFCSRKIACRNGKSRGRPHKKSISFAFVNEECEGGDACRISLVDGGCPAPFPQNKFLKYNRLIQKKSRRNDDGFYGPFEYNGHRFGYEHQQHQRMFGWDKSQWDDPSDDEDDGDKSSSAAGDEGIQAAAAPSVESSSSTGVSLEKTLPTSSDEREPGSLESPEQNSKELSKSNETTEKPPSSMSKESSSSSREQRGHGGRDQRQHQGRGFGKRYTPYIPLWHCVKSEKLNTCLCCCGGYFPDIETGKCVLVKHGNLYPLFDMFGNA
uniref:Uncharacterized protein n=1 Tax=Romanomermis culicivorax TaxID=13658 RepID=A0A915IBQ1_ROMCU